MADKPILEVEKYRVILSEFLDKNNLFELITAGYNFTYQQKMTDEVSLTVENSC